MRPVSRRHRLAALAAGAVLTLSGCGVPERVTGLRPAPTERATGAVFSTRAADQVGTGALDLARQAMAPGADAAQRKTSLTGPALRLAAVDQKFLASGASTAFQVPAEATVLGVSRGRQWPRSILATARQDDVQTIYVLREDDERTPFLLHTATALLPGATVPALPARADGIESISPTAATGLVASPQKVFDTYAGLLSYPAKKVDTKIVGTGDAFATALLQASAQQAKALGTLGTFTRSQLPYAEDIVAFRLADGSALAFAQVRRTDTLKPTKKAKELLLPEPLAKLAGTGKVTESVRLDYYENLIALIPASGEATVIGAGEQLRGITPK